MGRTLSTLLPTMMRTTSRELPIVPANVSSSAIQLERELKVSLAVMSYTVLYRQSKIRSRRRKRRRTEDDTLRSPVVATRQSPEPLLSRRVLQSVIQVR
jgi:hypothetical protein